MQQLLSFPSETAGSRSRTPIALRAALAVSPSIAYRRTRAVSVADQGGGDSAVTAEPEPEPSGGTSMLSGPIAGWARLYQRIRSRGRGHVAADNIAKYAQLAVEQVRGLSQAGWQTSAAASIPAR